MSITIDLAEAIEHALTGIENVSVFQGFVPESVPEYLPNHIKPYVEGMRTWSVCVAHLTMIR